MSARDALVALGPPRLHELATRVGASPATSAAPEGVADAVLAAVSSAEDLRHLAWTQREVEQLGQALGVGTRAAWKPRVDAETFEKLPFYAKPSYDEDVWSALAAAWPSTRAPADRTPRPVDLATSFIHLGLGATAIPQEPFTGMDWYERYGARTARDGNEGRLVSMYTFDTPWTSWEMHPSGHEVVLCTAGTLVLHQEHADGTVTTTRLAAGQAAINAPGVWHTADVDAPATAVFITAGVGTQHRPRT